MGPTVRLAEPADFVPIRPLIHVMGRISEEGLQERFEDYSSREDHCLLVAIEGQELVGYAWAQDFGPHLRSGQRYARLHDLAVMPEHRRRGVGRALFEAVTRWCQESAVIELQWQAALDAAPFYEKLGLHGDTKSDLDEYPHYEIAISCIPDPG